MSTVHGGQGSIITQGLVLRLDAANPRSYEPPYTSTAWKDISGNGNNGTLTNGPTFNSGNGGSIVFDGVDDYVTISDKAELEVVPFSFSCWFKTSQLGSRGGIAYKYSQLTIEKGWFVSNLTNGRIRVWIGSAPNNYKGKDTLLSYNNNVWYNVCMRVPDYNTVQIFVNGTETSYSTIWNGGAVSSLDTTEPIQIGASTNYNQYYNGNISTALYYNRALSSTEILQNYNAQKSRFGL